VNMLMRINVSGIPSCQVAKGFQLSFQLRHDGMRILQWNHSVKKHPLAGAEFPFRQFEVDADTKLGVRAPIQSGVPSRRPPHHQTGAGHDALLVYGNDAAIHTRALPKIVRIHDEVFRGTNPQIPKSLRSFCITVSARKYSSAIAKAARLCLS